MSDFINNVLCVSADTSFRKELTTLIGQKSSKLNLIVTDNKSEISQVIADKTLHGIYFNLPDLTSCNYIIKVLDLYIKQGNPDLKVFFTSENFETFQEVINNPLSENFTIFTWPAPVEEIAQKVHDVIFEKKLSKVVISNKSGDVSVDLEFIKVFINATKHSLCEMCSVDEIQHGKPSYMSDRNEALEKGIGSRIMISSEYFKGNFYVIFPEETFLKMYNTAVYEDHKEINDENRDFAGELANIIYGQSKMELSRSGLNLEMVIPSVHNSTQIEAELVILIPFDSSAGKFYIAIAPGQI